MKNTVIKVEISLLSSVNHMGETGKGLKKAVEELIAGIVNKNKGSRRISVTDLLRKGEEVKETHSTI